MRNNYWQNFQLFAAEPYRETQAVWKYFYINRTYFKEGNEMGVRGLFFILTVVVISTVFATNLGKSDILVFVIGGVIVGWGLDHGLTRLLEKLKNKKTGNSQVGKILDSSAIIDGRILDILETDFIEGDIIVPRFVLAELQMLADSEDGMKRARGRRGLDLIKSVQGSKKFKVIIEDRDYQGVNEVDEKLVRLAKDISGDVITTDFNLNKVATIQGIKVLNINKLSNALKPVVIPNEELIIELIKKGDRDGQAIGYLNDGTMVVAEDGGPFLGKTITLLVTSVYPTAAGRMIFGKVKRK